MTLEEPLTQRRSRRWWPAMRRGLRCRLLGISTEEASYDRRGFPSGACPERARFEEIGRIFIGGYLTALEAAGDVELESALHRVPTPKRGFAYEGAAMAVFLGDLLSPWRRARLPSFIQDAAADHLYMAHVGAGWALARVPWRLRHGLSLMDPLLRWLALDGYGFHEGYFHWRRSYEERRVPSRIRGYGRRAFDQGLGRALWFVEAATGDAVAGRIASFPMERHEDLWSGIGLAATYAGGASADTLAQLKQAAGEHSRTMAQGAAFAATARERAGNTTGDTELACQELCGVTAAEAAAAVNAAAESLPEDVDGNAFDAWRTRVREQY